jgi:KUP system potassium uptake protein
LKHFVVETQETSFFLGKETLVPSDKPDLNPLQEKIFLTLFRNASSAIQFFEIPVERVMEIGAQFEV